MLYAKQCHTHGREVYCIPGIFQYTSLKSVVITGLAKLTTVKNVTPKQVKIVKAVKYLTGISSYMSHLRHSCQILSCRQDPNKDNIQ